MNINFDYPDIPNTKQIKNIMAGFDLKQHVDVPTHTAGHTLDLLFTRDDRMHPLLKSVSVTDLPSQSKVIPSNRGTMTPSIKYDNREDSWNVKPRTRTWMYIY